MTLQELKKICGNGETQFVEFKQYASEPNQIIEEISGFLNALGGRLFIGVKDDGEPVGLKFAEDDLSFLKQQIEVAIAPMIQPKFELVQVSNKRAVIVMDIPEGEEKPYRAIDPETGTSRIFYRVNDECIKASRELRSIMKQKARNHGQTIVYGEIEAAVLKEIDLAGRLTKTQIQEKLKYNSRNISDCLIRLVTSKVLKIEPATTGDMFQYNQPGSID